MCPQPNENGPVVALFCGGRDWNDADAIYNDVRALPDGSVVIRGGARGADRLAKQAAWHFGFHCADVMANWHRHGRSAGPLRNEAMLRLGPDVVYAYPTGGRGTADIIRRAKRAGIEVVVRE